MSTCASVSITDLSVSQGDLLAKKKRTLGLTVQATHMDGTHVVIKLIFRGNPVRSYRAIIRRMVSCQQALSHPYIVRLKEVRFPSTRDDILSAMLAHLVQFASHTGIRQQALSGHRVGIRGRRERFGLSHFPRSPDHCAVQGLLSAAYIGDRVLSQSGAPIALDRRSSNDIVPREDTDVTLLTSCRESPSGA